MTAGAALRARHPDFLFVGLLCAVIIHAIAFALWPEYVPRPYRLRDEIITQWIDPIEDWDVPPPPEQIEPPRPPVDIVPSEEADRDETIEPNLFDNYSELPPLPPPPPPVEAFVAFDREPELLERAEPVYPDIARQARVEGTVIIEATTDIYGRVADVKILKSIPLLDQAAKDAVRQWVYEPMLINGRPRSVIFVVTVIFQLR